MTWEITKTYGHDLGLSCCFRQWKSDSHCHFLHGYALSFSFVFRRRDEGLDDRHWVIDYGDMKDIKRFLQLNYDHKTVAAEDDPELETLRELHEKQLIDLRVIPEVSTEMFAHEAGSFVVEWLRMYNKEVRLVRCEVREHGANSAVWYPSVPEKRRGPKQLLNLGLPDDYKPVSDGTVFDNPITQRLREGSQEDD